jgi:hypothetical protein
MTALSRIREGSGPLNKKKQLRSHFGKGQTEGSTSPLESIVAADKMAELGIPDSRHLYAERWGRTLSPGRIVDHAPNNVRRSLLHGHCAAGHWRPQSNRNRAVRR